MHRIERTTRDGRIASLCLGVGLCLLLPGFAIAKKIRVVTEPVRGGRVFVDGRYAGTAPVVVDVRIRKNMPITITAEKEGALMEEPAYILTKQQSSATVRLVSSIKRYTVATEPVEEGRISVDGDFVGIAPVSVDLSVTRTEPYMITAEKVGAIGAWPRKINPSIGETQDTLVLRLEEDEAMQATEESDISNKWITITPHSTLGRSARLDTDKVWQKLVSIITDNFPDLEQIDRSSYYIRSAWRVREYPFRVLRHRLVIKRGVSDDFTLRVLLESQIAPRSDGSYREEEFQFTRRIFRIDSETISFLRDQL